MNRLSRRAALLGGLLGAIAATGALAQGNPANYPTQPIRMIVPFAPGGASDFVARIIQPGMSQYLGQQVVIENRAGAAGNVGMDVAARATPDGYTVFLGNVGTIAINPGLFPELTVKPDQDFVGVSLVVEVPGILIANPKFPPNNVKEFVDYVKARPGKVNFASPGSGSLNRLEMEVLRKEAGLDMTHIPYKGGAGPAVADVLGGHVEVMFVTISSAINHVKEGRLKALAVSTKERVAALPNVPTMHEQGFQGNVSSSWQGLFVPAKTPKPVIEKLYAALTHTLADEKVRSRLMEASVMPVMTKSQDEFKAYVEAEGKKWSRVIKEVGAQPD